ncbi:MAG TPA: PQQ-binding-like beta-propeller repeat protein [Steroidobacteraceae bacterium]|nr:PQQ-binding-like beta-propeller repeat protein [Steroidobacteraceae bacterium]
MRAGKIGFSIVTAALALVLPCACAVAAAPAETQIKVAPAFDAKQLTTLPTTQWITNGGTVFNQRYSPLQLLNRDNVAGLKALWRTGMGSGLQPGYAGEAQILVYGDTLYVVNGANDVFAMDVDTGKILWTYHGNPNPEGGSPLGRASRGVALGEGKVFVGHTDARLAALDQRTGKVIWSIQAERWQDGFAITAAPLYYDGLVIVGFNGGEMGVRGRIKAYDAKTGKLRWVFYTIPAPGEPGHESWPQNSDAWKRGGASIWQTPAIDPQLGLLYFSTGNPAPDLHGDVRPGNNLYSVSILALDAKTGKYRWHYQQVHHDIWDYDSPNPVVLFDSQINGKPVKGLVEVSKTGWAYILDRVTGKPLIGIEERPVPQEPRQATAATQPYPIGDPIVPHEIDITPDGAHLAPGTTELPNKGRIFTPFWTEPVMAKPGTMGGANWPPSSYDPETHLLYVCASDRISVFSARAKLEQPAPNKPYMGGAFTQAQVADAGILAAVDVTTNKLVWRQQWREICYSGSVVTAGGLLFVGRADGRLTALDKSNGNRLWEFTTDAGVNTTVTTFEHNGKQYVAVHAGGGLFANGKRGDGVWMFSLDGKIPSLTQAAAPRSAAAAFGGPPGGRPAAIPTPTRAANVGNGEKIYKAACVACHGATGEGGEGGGAPLVNGLTRESILATTTTGKNNMPSFTSSYSTDELNDVAAYVTSVLAKRPK